jgi:hypothetical protein
VKQTKNCFGLFHQFLLRDRNSIYHLRNVQYKITVKVTIQDYSNLQYNIADIEAYMLLHNISSLFYLKGG